MPPSKNFIAEQYSGQLISDLESLVERQARERKERQKSEPITGGEWWRFLHPGEPEEQEE